MVNNWRPEYLAMFAIFEKLFRSNKAAPTGRTTATREKPSLYSVAAPVWRADDHCGVYRGLGGNTIATAQNPAQAQTLCDTLNLANGGKPSRRLLDAIYREEVALADE
jgi:hypothetical protein